MTQQPSILNQARATWNSLPTAAKAALVVGGYCCAKEIYGALTEKSLQGEVAVITGGGSGIGALLAKQLAIDNGVTVAIWDLNLEQAEDVAAEIRSAGGNCRAYRCDVTNRELVYSLAKEVAQDLGAVTILVNNAGIVSGKKLLEVPDRLVEATFAVNAVSHIWTLKAFLPAMLEANHGHVVTVASQAGQIGVAGLVDYCGSKFAAVGVDESLRMELNSLGKTGVKTTCVCPFYINTGMFDGVKMKFPWNLLLFIMEPKYVTDRMVKAIKRDQKVLMLPPATHLGTIARGLLPTGMFDQVVNMLGVNSSMEDFKGNSKSFDRSKS